ncbi:tape measure protein [Fusobacterium periodonticum]|uniref:tape measure protein n=1 Tax=Fusobacterium periodonticum TaxID=860 RepID=UPI0028D3A13C|nr:tape measure protein [Fusobacterium periodonticum]
MSTIQGSIMLMDAMSTPLNNIVGAINTTIVALQNVNNTDVSIDTSRLANAQTMIVQAGAQLNEIEKNIQKRIQDNVVEQNKFNTALSKGVDKANSLYGKIKSFIGLYAGIQTVRMGLDVSDNISQTTARLNMINDGKQTTDQLQQAIFQSAKNSRAGFLDTANVVSKLGLLAPQAFNSNMETVKFSELMAKSFKVGGASTSEQTSGMYQLTQAMASGKLQGDEFRSIMENAPLLAQAISKYTGKSIGDLKEMSKDGLITSDVIKNSVFAMSDEINTKFNSIPMTFGDVVTQIKSNAVNSFMSISSTMSGIFNSERFQGFIDGVSSFINKAFVMINWLIKGISMVGTVLYEIWGPIQPILVTVLGLLTAYKLVMGFIAVKTAIASGIATIYNLALLAKQTMLGAVSVALAQATAAQTGLNLAILTCPITWIIAGIALVIAAIYGVVAVFNKITGKAVSATGIIVGVFYWMGGMIYNIIAAAWNKLAQTFVSIYNLGVSIAEFFANVFKHPIRAVAHLFANFINFLIDKVKFLGSIIDTICGTNVVGKLETVQTAIGDWVNEKVGGNEITLKRMDATQVMMDRVGLKDMYNKGYEKGANFSLFGKNAETGIDTNTEFGNSTNPEVAKSNDLLKNIDKNTKKAGDMLDLSHDEISYLRDLAEREAINRFTTAEVKVDVGGITQHVASALDLDDIVDYMTNKMEEGIAIAAEGSYE